MLIERRVAEMTKNTWGIFAERPSQGSPIATEKNLAIRKGVQKETEKKRTYSGGDEILKTAVGRGEKTSDERNKEIIIKNELNMVREESHGKRRI